MLLDVANLMRDQKLREIQNEVRLPKLRPRPKRPPRRQATSRRS